MYGLFLANILFFSSFVDKFNFLVFEFSISSASSSWLNVLFKYFMAIFSGTLGYQEMCIINFTVFIKL